MLINNINQSNMPPSSPSPNTIITNVNHSNYLCNTILENQNTENIFQPNQNNEEQNDLSTNYKHDKNYEYSNETVTDIFENQQCSNNSLQICNMPFKKIVVIEQNYHNIKQEQELDEEITNTNENYSNNTRNYEFTENKAMNCNCQHDDNQNPYYNMNQEEPYNISNFYENSHSYDTNRTQINQNSKIKYMNVNNETQISQNVSYNIPVSSQLCDMSRVNTKYGYNEMETVKSSLNLNSNKEMIYFSSEMKQLNEKKNLGGKKMYSQLSQLNTNYNYDIQEKDNNKQSSCVNQHAKIYSEVETQFNRHKQRSEKFKLKNVDDLNMSTYNSTNNETRNHEYSLEEEQTRFHQGKTVVMQGCSQSKI